MDTTRFKNSDDELPLLDLTARFEFKTVSSIAFEIGRIETIPIPEMDHEFLGFKILGWVDVHHPCDSAINVRVRVCIPTEYHTFERMKAITEKLCEILSIPPEENCESRFFSADNVTGISPRVLLGMR